jgi:glyoxylase-like metal-dependent hydrolase (beta-lactamase superfamily II)
MAHQAITSTISTCLSINPFLGLQHEILSDKLLGAGGNIAVLTGPDGKLLVDAEIVTARPKVSVALASINADPIKQLINTHWHFDHTGGNEWLHEAGASILAQENTRNHLSKETRVEGWKHTHFPGRTGGRDPFNSLQRGPHSASQRYHSDS